MKSISILPAFGSLLPLLLAPAPLAYARETVYIEGTSIDGVTRDLDVSRYPALYTSDFADCLEGGSLFNVTKFDAAYYSDNSSVLYHLDGATNIQQESIVVHLAIVIYGENQFNITQDPCGSSIGSLCPLRADVPIEAFDVIKVSRGDVDGIPSIALGIPDLEGYAQLQIFANSTQTQIGCFQAVMTNGRSFSQPQIVASILGGFTILAIFASFVTAVYGIKVSAMRTHYAHSFSVLVIFETFQSIFFSGALSVQWPRMLPSWWSNFAWSAGMVAPEDFRQSVASFTGNTGNITQVGGAGSTTLDNGGGLLQQIYGRSLSVDAALKARSSSFARRADYDPNDPYDYKWGGDPQAVGMPMPGTWPGFSGTLSEIPVPVTEAFTIGLIWFVALLGAVAVFNVCTKGVLELLVRSRVIKSDGFDFYRSHWLGYLAASLLRALFIGFFAMMTLALYQFSLGGPAGPLAVAAIVFAVLLVSVGGLGFYSCYFRLRLGKFEAARDAIRLEGGNVSKKAPLVTANRESGQTQGDTIQTAPTASSPDDGKSATRVHADAEMSEEKVKTKGRLLGSLPFVRINYVDDDPNRQTVHEDEAYVKKFGWLSARYRRTRWWFFVVYIVYQFVRACFIGGGAKTPLAQVFGLFVFEFIALAIIIKTNPFEGARNTAAAVWMLSISKIITTGLSIAFLPDFGISRTAATVIGLVILVVQAFVSLAVLALVFIGLVSTWMSLNRNREKFPALLDSQRIQYYENLRDKSRDLPPQVLAEMAIQEQQAAQGTFNVRNVRRAPKIEDEDREEKGEMDEIPELDEFPETEPQPPITGPITPINRRNRANSASSRYSVSSLPRGARVHRASWSSRDFAQWDAEMNRPESQRMSHMRSANLRMQAAKHQNPMSMSEDSRNSMPVPERRPMTPTRESAEDTRLTIDTVAATADRLGPTLQEKPEVSPLTASEARTSADMSAMTTPETAREPDTRLNTSSVAAEDENHGATQPPRAT